MNLEKLEVKTDSRGSLVESFKLPNDGQIFYITILPHEVRGDHYHLRKTESFVVIYGSAIITSKDRETSNVMKVELSGDSPMAVTIPPNNTHNIEATDEGAIVLVHTTEQFDSKDSDTYPEEI